MPLPFEQQPKESHKAFAAFSVYLSLGPQRSLAAVGRKLGKNKVVIERWSAKFGWVSRVQAYAAHMAVAEREAVTALATAKAVDWLTRQQEHKEKEWELRCKLVKLAETAIERWLKNESRCGSLEGIARLLDLASKLGRLASGLATDKTEITGEGGGPVLVEFEAAVRKIYGTVVEVEVVPENSKLQIADSKRERREAEGDGLPGHRAKGAATPEKESRRP